MTNAVVKDYGLPQLTEEQLQQFMREHIDHGVAYIKYERGQATVLKYRDVHVEPSDGE